MTHKFGMKVPKTLGGSRDIGQGKWERSLVEGNTEEHVCCEGGIQDP